LSLLYSPLREPLLLDKAVTGWTSSKAALQSEAGVQKGRANTGQAGLINVLINKSRIADGGDQQTKDEVSRVMIGILDRCLQKIIWHCSS